MLNEPCVNVLRSVYNPHAGTTTRYTTCWPGTMAKGVEIPLVSEGQRTPRLLGNVGMTRGVICQVASKSACWRRTDHGATREIQKAAGRRVEEPILSRGQRLVEHKTDLVSVLHIDALECPRFSPRVHHFDRSLVSPCAAQGIQVNGSRKRERESCRRGRERILPVEVEPGDLDRGVGRIGDQVETERAAELAFAPRFPQSH